MKQQRIAGIQTVYPALRYSDARAAIAWLERAFGAARHVVYEAKDGSIGHAELNIAGNLIMLGGRDDGNQWHSSASIYVALSDAAEVDALFKRAVAAGAKVEREPEDTNYGSREFGVLDVEGHPWSFGTYHPQAQSA
jgi:uncharacterized glyoxalase superfamily protein PhnB